MFLWFYLTWIDPFFLVVFKSKIQNCWNGRDYDCWLYISIVWIMKSELVLITKSELQRAFLEILQGAWDCHRVEKVIVNIFRVVWPKRPQPNGFHLTLLINHSGISFPICHVSHAPFKISKLPLDFRIIQYVLFSILPFKSNSISLFGGSIVSFPLKSN